MARALRLAGVRRPYIVDGGFKAWRAAGLGVREKSAEYETTPLDAVSDAAESGEWGCGRAGRQSGI